MAERNLYYIAILPPEPCYSYVLKQKEYFAEHHESKASLKSPPHITVHMPFKLKEKKELILQEKLKSLTVNRKSFNLLIDGYGHFNERVVYLHVNKPDGLQLLFEEVRKCMKINFNQFNADYKNRGYNPHITIAFRDLKKEEFRKVWPKLKDKEVHFDFEVSSFTLLKHNGKSWDVFKTFKF